MFTGIIEEKGTILSIRRSPDSCVLQVGCRDVLTDSGIGDSIAVNGVCLTITSKGDGYFTADVMTETLSRSSLGSLTHGSAVNLERAMPADGRFGGHIVAGHIDGTGTVQAVTPDGNAVWYEIAAAPELLRYIVDKGSIAIDGVSLTVAYVDERCFRVSIIPHTLDATTFPSRRAGDIVNLECDMIGKYVERLLLHPAQGVPDGQPGGLTEDFLKECGF